VKIDPLSMGWAKVAELRRHVALFRASGKWALCYMERGGEKEYALASAFGELFAPPTAGLGLRGFAVSGTFLRGVLDKIGVEPEVRRIGAYKSAGDQLLRKHMAAEQRESLNALLDDVYGGFVADAAAARGKTEDALRAFVDEGAYEMERFVEGGWLDGLMYEDELDELVRSRTGGKADELRAGAFFCFYCLHSLFA
jgi:protease-4